MLNIFQILFPLVSLSTAPVENPWRSIITTPFIPVKPFIPMICWDERFYQLLQSEYALNIFNRFMWRKFEDIRRSLTEELREAGWDGQDSSRWGSAESSHLDEPHPARLADVKRKIRIFSQWSTDEVLRKEVCETVLLGFYGTYLFTINMRYGSVYAESLGYEELIYAMESNANKLIDRYVLHFTGAILTKIPFEAIRFLSDTGFINTVIFAHIGGIKLSELMAGEIRGVTFLSFWRCQGVRNPVVLPNFVGLRQVMVVHDEEDDVSRVR